MCVLMTLWEKVYWCVDKFTHSVKFKRHIQYIGGLGPFWETMKIFSVFFYFKKSYVREPFKTQWKSTFRRIRWSFCTIFSFSTLLPLFWLKFATWKAFQIKYKSTINNIIILYTLIFSKILKINGFFGFDF